MGRGLVLVMGCEEKREFERFTMGNIVKILEVG